MENYIVYDATLKVGKDEVSYRFYYLEQQGKVRCQTQYEERYTEDVMSFREQPSTKHDQPKPNQQQQKPGQDLLGNDWHTTDVERIWTSGGRDWHVLYFVCLN